MTEPKRKGGAYNREERRQEMLKEAITLFDIVIERKGELKPVAEEVKGSVWID